MKERLDLNLLTRLIPQLVALAKQHWASCDWQEGAPTEVFADDGFICIRYASGAWYHYDLDHGTWF